MQRVFFLLVTSLLSILIVKGTDMYQSPPFAKRMVSQDDSLQRLQLLYRGITWTNKYHRYTGDQFFKTPLFVPGTVSISGRTYKNLRIKYDISSDEIITPLNSEEIIQLNKEMIDSFTLVTDKKKYSFINFRNDTISGLAGYCNLLYKGKASLYVKYIKRISTSVTTQSDGEFNQSYRIFVVSGGITNSVRNKKDILEILSDRKNELNEYIKKNRLKISRFDPDSFLPVIKYYDSIQN